MTDSALEHNPEDTTVKTEEGLIINGLYSQNGMVLIAINENALAQIMATPNESRLYERTDGTELLASPGDEEWVYRMKTLRTRLLTDLSNERAERARLQDYVTGLGEALKSEAERRDWCEEYDSFAEEWDLPRRHREYEVTMTVRVRAADEDEATELVAGEVSLSSNYGYGGHEWLTDGPDFSTCEA